MFPSKLAAANIRQLHRRSAGGTRPIDELYAHSDQGYQAPTASVQEKYFAVFSQALDCFMGNFVLDYVEEVCGDSQLTAADPVDASLLDGALVKTWCERELGQQEAQLHAALKSEPLFSQLVSGPELQRCVSKAHTLVCVLEALGRIRGEAAQSQQQLAAGGAAPAGPGSSGVQAELSQAKLLEQALRMLSWCVRQGLTGQPGTRSARTGVHASMPEWLRRVQSRRERRPGYGLFLDDMLQALHVPGGYPFSSVANAVFLLGCVVRDAGAAAFTTKLGVLAYYLMDLTGDTVVGPDGSCTPLLADLAAAFHLPLATVAAWQAAFLLDAAPQAAAQPSLAHQPQPSTVAGEGKGTEVGRACALLVAHTQPDLPIKFIEVLVALGQHDTALVIHRGQAVGGAASTSLQQARTLMELRLRCGLLAEALQLARAYAATQAPAPARCEALRVLLTALFEWAVAAQQQQQQQQQQQAMLITGSGEGTRDSSPLAHMALLELCFTEEEEEVLTKWLVEAASQGRAGGDFLPLMLASRGRVTEALGGFKLWSDHRSPATPAFLPKGPITSPRLRPSPRKAPLGAASAAQEEGAIRAGVIDALINAQAELLALPQRNVAIPVAPPGTETGCALPAALVEGLSLQVDADAPVMEAGFLQQQLGGDTAIVAPPPFMRTRFPPPPAAPAQPRLSPSQPHAPHAANVVNGLQGGVQAEAGAPAPYQAGSAEGVALGSFSAQVEGGMNTDSLAGGGGGPVPRASMPDGPMMFNLGGVGQHHQWQEGSVAVAGAQLPPGSRQKRPRNNGLHCMWL